MRTRYAVVVVIILLGVGVKLNSVAAITSEAAARSRTAAGVDDSRVDRDHDACGRNPRRTPSHIPGGGHALNSLVTTYIAWIVAQTGLVGSQPPADPLRDGGRDGLAIWLAGK